MPTNVIEVHDLSRRFVIRKEKSLKERLVNFGRSNLHKEDFWALRDINLDITAGSTVGLVGPNGSGKSTLLKLIGGILQPTTGSVRTRGRLAALLELGAGFHPDLTGRENVYLNASILGLTREQTDRYFDAIVDFSGIEPFIDTQVKFYSSGMYVRLAFAVAVHVDPDVLLVDEVLAVGDEPFQRKCMDRIRAFQHEGRTIVLVSHGMDQVAELCERAVVLEHGRIKADGPPVEALRVLRDDFEAARREDVERALAVQPPAPSPDEDPDDREPVPSAIRTRVVAVEVAADGQVGTDVGVEPGADVTVTVDVTTEVPLEDWFLGIAINDPLGRSDFGTTPRLRGIALPCVTGDARFRFQMASLQLGEGAYTIDAAVSLADGMEAHRAVAAARIVSRTAGHSVGPVYAEAKFSEVPVASSSGSQAAPAGRRATTR
jgi:ABC-2 type transport system ATP-binding protein